MSGYLNDKYARDNQIRWNSTDDDWWNTALYGEITLVER